MKRQFVAASAGFCVACIVWIVGRSGVVTVPQIHVSFDRDKREAAEPVFAENTATAGPTPHSESDTLFHFASYSPTAALDLTEPKIDGTRVDLSANASTAVVLLVDGKSSVQFTTMTSAGTTLKVINEEGTEVSGVGVQGQPIAYSLSAGRFHLTLSKDGESPKTARILVFKATENNGDYILATSDSGLIKKLELKVSTAADAKPLLFDKSKAAFVSDGSTAVISLENESGLTASTWQMKLGKLDFQAVSAPKSQNINKTGDYTVRLEGKIAALVSGTFQVSQVNTVSMRSFNIKLSSSDTQFKPRIDSLTQDLSAVLPVGDTVKFEVKAAELSGVAWRLDDSKVTLNFQTALANRPVELVDANGMQLSSATSGAAATSSASNVTNIPIGKQSLALRDIWADELADPARVQVDVPTRALDRPEILFFGVNSDPASLKAIVSATAPLDIKGRSVHLVGSAPGAASVELLVLSETTTGSKVFRKTQSSLTTNLNAEGLWSVNVNIEGPLEPQRLIVAIALGQLTHRYSQAIKVQAKSNTVNTVQLAKATATYKSSFSDSANAKDGVVGATTAVITVSDVKFTQAGDRLIAIVDGKVFQSASPLDGNVTSSAVTVTGLKTMARNEIRLAVQRGSESSSELLLELFVVDSGPKVVGVAPLNFGTAPGQSVLRIRFSPENPLEENSAREKKNYVLVHNGGQGPEIQPTEAAFDETRNEVSLKFASTTKPLTPDVYELRINGHKTGNTAAAFASEGAPAGATIGIQDRYGNLLAGSATGGIGSDYSHAMSETGSAGAGALGDLGFPMAPRMALSEITAEEPDLLTQRVGLPDTTGPPVDYLEFTKPRKEQNGFNPSDKVVSRVARTYFFRDAHRMVQIINRRVKSYNAQNATMSRQLADKARLFAEQTIDRRKEAERGAVNAAGYARQAQNMISRLQSDLQTAETNIANGTAAVQNLRAQLPTLQAEAANPDLVIPGKYPNDNRTAPQRLSDLQSEIAALDAAVQKSQQDAALFRERSSASISALDALRERELEERETMNREQAKEDRAVDHQFRLEVQAAHTDPDTYAPGIPDSDDPVAQVSMSVIGEGLIQMRGPLKGVNIIHTMINEIDSPVGQVRVGIHTIQINGEKGMQMEEVAGRIQRYTDHSRFLTSQSTQMLRNAVALVASRKAEECGVVCDPGVVCEDGTIIPADTNGMQAVGMNGMPGSASIQRYQDAFFGAEFMAQLRAMDSEFVNTGGNKLLSLNSMDSTSLASALFLMALASNQTRMEILDAFQQSTMYKLPADEFEYFETSDTKLRYHFKKFKFMADNARFVSLRGYFDSEIVGDNTLNPAQREFIKLAQILKSRLITEIELKQRVVERALIEERVGNYKKQLQDAVAQEKMAIDELKEHQQSLRTNLTTVLGVVNNIDAQAELERRKIWDHVNTSLKTLQPVVKLEGTDRTIIRTTTDASFPSILPDARSKAFSDLLQLPEEWRFQAETSTLDSLDKVVTTAQSAAFKALQDNDYEGFMRAVFEMNEKVFKLATQDKNTPSEIKVLLNDPNTADFADISLKYGEQAVLKLIIERGPAVDPKTDIHLAYHVHANSPEELKAFRTWISNQASEIRRNDLANGLPDEFSRKLSKELALAVDFTEPKYELLHLFQLAQALKIIQDGTQSVSDARFNGQKKTLSDVVTLLRKSANASISNNSSTATRSIEDAHRVWVVGKIQFWSNRPVEAKLGLQLEELQQQVGKMDRAMADLLQNDIQFQFASANAQASRRPLDHKKFLDMLIDETEEKHIQLLEGTRAHTAVIDDYVKRICTALEDDFNTQFYEPAFRQIREQTYGCGTVSLGQIEHTTILTNNREFAKVQPQATMEFDLPRRRIMVAEALSAAQAGINDYGALLSDPNFLALAKLNSGQSTASTYTGDATNPAVRSVLPGLPSDTGESAVIQARTGEPEFASQLEALIPDPSIYKFETGTGFEIRPVIQPDGQSVVFDFNYMYTTNIREPVDADEKHLGRVKRHFIDTDVQIGNYELREVSRYRVALKAERSGRGVPLLEDIPVAGALFRPMNNGESSLQQNIILAQTVIYPTLFDLMGLRWAPAVADLNEEDIKLQEFTYRNRMRYLKNEVYDYSSAQVDEFLRIPQGERRADLYRTQVPIPVQHPNGYMGPGNNQQDSTLQEGYVPQGSPGDSMVPGSSGTPGFQGTPGFHGMPGESGIMIPPVDCAPLLPYEQGAFKPAGANPLRSRVTPATHRATGPTFPANDRSSNVETQDTVPGRVRLSDLRPPVSQKPSDRQNMPQLKTTPPRSIPNQNEPGQQRLLPRQTSERGSSPAQAKSSVPISRTAANSSKIRSGRATLDEPNDDSTSLKQPETQRNGWRTRIPGMSNSGK